MKISIRFLAFALIVAAASASIAQEAAAPPAIALDTSTEAKVLLQRAIDFVAGLPAYSVDIAMKVEIADTSGQSQKVELAGKLSISGKDKARYHLDTDAGAMELFFSPESKYLYLAQQNQYMEGTAFGERREALTKMPGREFRAAQIMLSDFLHATPALLADVESASIVKAEGEAPESPDHVQVVGDGLTTDFYLRRGDQPLLERFTVDLLKVAGESSPGLSKALLTYTFTNWNTSPEFAPDHFNFVKPEGATKFDPAANRPADPLTGKPAPAIKLPMLGEGTLDLASHAGKDIVILDFWASWCGPCRQGLPIVSDLAKQFKDKNVVFYAINIGETAEVAKNFLAQTGMDIPVALDPNREAQQKYQANSIPKTVIIAKDGTIYKVESGVSPTTKEDLTRILTELTK